MIGAEEDARLFLRLADLPGFDPEGLRARYLNDEENEHLIDDESVIELMRVYRSGSGPWQAEDVVFISTAHARTRDALARWTTKAPRATAPEYTYSWVSMADEDNHPVGFVVWLGETAVGASTTGAAEFFDCPHIPALGDLNPDSERLLPDGSRLVDAVALAAVARHVGGQP